MKRLGFVSNFCPKQFTVRGSQFFLKMCHCWCPAISIGHVAFLIIHFSPRSVTAGVRPFPLTMQHFYSCVSQVCHYWCPSFSAGDATFPFICFPALSLLVSALFGWPCSMSVHLFPGSVTGVAALFRWPCSMSIHLSPMFFLSFCLSGLVPALLFSARPVGWNRFTCCVIVSGIAFLPHCATLSFVFLFGQALGE